MRKTSTIFLFLVLLVYVMSCVHEPESTGIDDTLKEVLSKISPSGSYEGFILPRSNDYAAIPNQDVKNPLSEEKVKLGKMLFFETGLGLEPAYSVSKEAYSCGSCHIPSRGFTAGRFQGIADGAIGFGESGEGRVKNSLYRGDDVDAQGARPLPLINTAFVTNALWAGQFGSFGANVGTESVWRQDTLLEINYKGLQGLEANNERALIVHRQVVNKQVTDSLGYTAIFDKCFPEIPAKERYSRRTAGFAIAAYLRSIVSDQAPFQKWLKGDATAMNEQQKKGALLFFGKAGCANCHNSPSLNSQPHRFFALGVKNLYQNENIVFRTGPTDKRNLGRGGFTERAEDMHKFKVPQLYNMKDLGFYFHGASKRSLREVVEYFNNGVPENPEVPESQITGLFHPLGLTSAEMDDLVEFLENGLYDPNLSRYAPDAVLSGYCFPNNDPLSRSDMNCK